MISIACWSWNRAGNRCAMKRGWRRSSSRICYNPLMDDLSWEIERKDFSMALSHQSNLQRITDADPLYRKLHRAFFAVCMLLGPLTMAVWFGTCPQLGDPGCPNGGSMAVYTAFRTLNPLVMQIFLVANLLVSYVWPVSYIGLGMIAMKHSPWLTTVGLAFGLAGGLPFGGVVAAQASLFYGMAQMDYTPLFVTITQHI